MCGIVGIYNNEEAANLAYMGLYAQQHRGQESAGIVSSDNGDLHRHASLGLVSDVFKDTKDLKRLHGNLAIGHVRYSTTGDDNEKNVGPLWNYSSLLRKILGKNYKDNRRIAVSHNGNLTNLEELHGFSDGITDTKIIIDLLEKLTNPKDAASLKKIICNLKGSYAFLAIIGNKMIATRDVHGIRPLCFGKLGESYIFASETCALDLLGATYVRDVEPGEVIVLDGNNLNSYYIGEKRRSKHCIFEHVYFARPDSKIFGQEVSVQRRNMGKQLAKENPTPDCDVVISVPDSSNIQAMAFAETQNKKYDVGLIRNHYIGRTFIYPNQRLRDLSVKLKFNVDASAVRGKKVAVIDDSIVRGTTLRKLTKLIIRAGAKEVHVRSCSPPVKFPCFYGMDFPTRKELIANNKNIEETKEELGADSLGYLSLSGLLKSAEGEDCEYCTACFSGNYIDEENNHE